MIPSPYRALSMVYLGFFFHPQPPIIRNYLHEQNSKFYVNLHYECEALFSLVFLILPDDTTLYIKATIGQNLKYHKDKVSGW